MSTCTFDEVILVDRPAAANGELYQTWAPRRGLATPKRNSGVAAVEMAIVAPFLIALVLLGFEMARMMMVKQAMDNAAREGCRKAVLASTWSSSSAEATVREYLAAVIPNAGSPSVIDVNVQPDFSSGIDSNTLISVSVTVKCADASWLPPQLFAGATIQSKCSMQRE